MIDLKKIANKMPSLPGVYQFTNQEQETLYIGKAKNLKKRVNQYFGHDKRLQIPHLLAESSNISFTVTANELEALYLETTLIQKLNPKYNIDLKDDKSLSYISINYEKEIPEISITRNNRSNKNTHLFGPYSSTHKTRKLLDFIRKNIGFCNAKKITHKPCFYYHIKRCPGICTGQVSIIEYKEHLKLIEKYLSGEKEYLIKKLTKQMKAFSKQKAFEAAGKIKEQLNSINVLIEKQNVVLKNNYNIDVWGSSADEKNTCLYLMKIRQGKLFDFDTFISKINGRLDYERRFIEKYYKETSSLPKIIISNDPDLSIENRVENPKTGFKKQLLDTSNLNANIFLKKSAISAIRELYNPKEVLTGLQTLLSLEKIPERIECYDISNVQGSNPVASMVVMTGGMPDKSQYRKFKIRSKDTPDDFAMMSEVITRRLNNLDNKEAFSKKPDLIVIDGGKGQLSSVHKIIGDKIPHIGLAKRIEEIFLPHTNKPIVLPHNNPILQLLQRIRDEAHRFAITFHRSLRSKKATRSELDEIKGLGPKTIKILKQRYGTKKEALLAPREELEQLVGKYKASLLK